MSRREHRADTRKRPRLKKWVWLAVAAAVVVVAAAATAGVVLAVGDGGRDDAPQVRAPGPRGVAGYAFQDRNGNGAHDSGERVLVDWPVEFYASGPLPLEQAETTGEGTFVFQDVEYIPADTTTVRLRVPPVMEGPANDTLPDTTRLSQSFTVALGDTIAIPVASYRLCIQQEECPGLELPQLRPLLTSSGGPDYPAPTETSVDTTTQPGRTLLRFATSVANEGGLLHVVGLDDSTAETQTVEQRVYGDGVVLVHRAGTFTYHPEHHHVHVDDFVRYDLLAENSDEVLRSSGKMSFCLTDIQPISTQISGPSREDGALFLDLPPLECGEHEQGINTGFADYYGPLLPDQWIDVTGLESGTYRIRFTVDPNGLLLDADPSDNSAEFTVEYVAP